MVDMFPSKSQHTPGAHPRQSPYPTMKGFPLQPVGKGLGVCSKGVLKQPQNVWVASMTGAFHMEIHPEKNLLKKLNFYK